MTGPLVTVGIVSCNRLHYLRALITSLHECLQYDPLQWVIVDNASIEPGLREYLQSLDFVDDLILRPERSPRTEHVEAMNTIAERARGDYLLLLPEDVQFIVRGRWMESFVELLSKCPEVGSLTFDAQRRVTLERFFPRHNRLRRLLSGWHYRTYVTSSRLSFLSYGSRKPGIIGAGIMSFSPMRVWQQLGPWKATGDQTVGDSSGGGETEMLDRYVSLGMRLQRVLAQLPVAADVVTDPRGTKGRVRGNRRYGEYWPPKEGQLYYRVWEEEELRRHISGWVPLAFEEVVEPRGFRLPLDESANLLKNPFRSPDDPFRWIHASVEGVDI